MAVAIARPKLEGNIAVGDDRQVGFAEFGDPQGRAIFWLHGTPGARRQIPMEARVYAEQQKIRLIGVDRPASAPPRTTSTKRCPHSPTTCAPSRTRWGSTRFVVGLSGGGPYTLACAAAMPIASWPRASSVVLPRPWAPTPFPEVDGVRRTRVAPLLQVAGGPIGLAASDHPADPAGRVPSRYLRTDVTGSRPRLLARPEIKAMFLDDAQRQPKQMAAPFSDVVVFARDWGFRLDEIKVPVRWWHGDHDHIVPFAHGQHVVSKLSDAELYHLPGESHLAGLGRAEEILHTMIKVWDEYGEGRS